MKTNGYRAYLQTVSVHAENSIGSLITSLIIDAQND